MSYLRPWIMELFRFDEYTHLFTYFSSPCTLYTYQSVSLLFNGWMGTSLHLTISPEIDFNGNLQKYAAIVYERNGLLRFPLYGLSFALLFCSSIIRSFQHFISFIHLTINVTVKNAVVFLCLRRFTVHFHTTSPNRKLQCARAKHLSLNLIYKNQNMKMTSVD